MAECSKRSAAEPTRDVQGYAGRTGHLPEVTFQRAHSLRTKCCRPLCSQVAQDLGREPEHLQPARREVHLLAPGFTPRNALEVVLGIGAYPISTFTNRMTAAPLDPPFEPFGWGARTTAGTMAG